MPRDNHKRGPDLAVSPVGQYYLLDKIAQGGMAEIFKGLAYDLHGLKKTVVIKKILPQIAADPEFVNMLINEAKIAVMLSHGNIAQIFDLGKVGDDYFMVMEFVDGKSLSQIHRQSLKKGELIPIEYICYFISEVANGLNYMHRRSDDQGRNLGIIHRDISPQNVIVSYSGTVKIIDFGIAKAAMQVNITDSGVLKGKFAYMSPEQARGEPIDPRSDVFSLGIILHELLTGGRLFKGANKRETLQNVRRGSVPAPSLARRDLPEAIDTIVLKTLSKDPKNRYLWASEFHDDLVKFLYTHYPNFQPSTVTTFIRNLFAEEISEREELDEDAKTPLMIIDHTQSAILPEALESTDIMKVPPQIKEFMLEETTPVADKKELMKIEEEFSLKEEEPEKEPFFERCWKSLKERFDPRTFFRDHWKAVTISVMAVIMIAAAVIVMGGNHRWIPFHATIQTWLSRSSIVIEVEPPDATVLFGGIRLTGDPPYRVNNIKPNLNYRMIVEKEGFVPYFHAVSIKKGDRRKLQVVLKPEPPHYASLDITSNPEGAKVFLNEKDTNLITPTRLSDIRPNQYHSIGLYLGDHIFWGRDIQLKPDERSSLHIDLTLNVGELQIIATPTGASVAIDGVLVGTTPYTQKNVEPGKIIELIVGKEGFTVWKKKTKVKAGETLVLRPRLTRTKDALIPHFLRNLDRPIPPPPTDEEASQSPTPGDVMLPPAPIQ